MMQTEWHKVEGLCGRYLPIDPPPGICNFSRVHRYALRALDERACEASRRRLAQRVRLEAFAEALRLGEGIASHAQPQVAAVFEDHHCCKNEEPMAGVQAVEGTSDDDIVVEWAAPDCP